MIIPIETLIKLAQDNKDNKIEVRLAVAGSENASADILEKLSQDTTDEIREIVVQNPNTELLTLQKLAFFDNLEKVKFAISKNQNVSKVILQILECDCSFQIRRNANYFLQKRFGK